MTQRNSYNHASPGVVQQQHLMNSKTLLVMLTMEFQAFATINLIDALGICVTLLNSRFRVLRELFYQYFNVILHEPNVCHGQVMN